MLWHSEEIGQITAAVLAVQRAVDHVTKDSTNPHFGSSYADLNAFLHALRAPMAEHGITMVQGPGMEEGRVVLDTMLVHTSGEWMRNRSSAPMQKNDPQGVGSAITYLRRYSLAALFAIPQEDDDGNAASGPRESHQPASRGAFSVDDPIPFGKYKGHTWRAVIGSDRQYVGWALHNMDKLTDEQKDAIRAAMDEAGSDAEPDDMEVTAMVMRVEGDLDTATTLGLVNEDGHAQIARAIKERDPEKLAKALEWLKKKMEAGKMAGATS